MYAYRFRLLFDDVEGFVRDYEILARQNFKEFHDVIIASIKGLESQELASFYICDRKWNKMQEITLLDMNDKDDQEQKKQKNSECQDNEPIVCMSEAVINEFIDDPHQRLIYEYNFIHTKTFYLELMETFQKKPRVKYPRCILANEELPPEVHNIPKDELSIKNLLAEEEEEEDYYDEEDLRNLNDDFEL